MPVGGDSKENLIFLRIVAHTIAVLYHCTKAKEDFVMGNGNLKGEGESRKCIGLLLHIWNPPAF